jgi:hypothetical protein
MTNDRSFAAIDPLALVLSNAAYVRLTLPDPSPEEVKASIRKVAERLRPDERRVAAENLRALEGVIDAVQAEFRRAGEIERPQVQAR